MSTPIRVLILEDRAEDAELMLHELRQAGFDPKWQIVDTEAAYLAALPTDPDVILADWSLPQFNGLRGLQLLNERGLDIPFIIISGSIGEEVAVEAMRQGASDYLLKDRLVRLGQVVLRSLENKQLREKRRQAEDALYASEEQFRNLFENAPVGIYRTTPEGRIVLANPALIKMLGYETSDDLAHRDLTMRGFEPSYSRQEFQKNIEQQGQISGLESSWMLKDGSTIFVRESARLVRDSNNHPLYYEGTVEDITERKQVEEKLRETSEHLTHILANSPTIIYCLSVHEGKVKPVWISANIETIFGFTPQDAHRSSWWLPQVHPQDRPRVQKSQEHLLDDFFQQEYRFTCKDGRQVCVHDEHRLLRDADGNPHEIIGVWTDITWRRKADQALQESEERYREMMEQAADAVIMHDATGRIMDVNQKTCLSLGYSQQELLSMSIGEIDPEAMHAGIKKQWRKVLAGDRITFESHHSRKDGTSFPVEVSMGSVRLPQGSLILGIVRDITERKLAEKALRESEERWRSLVSASPDYIALHDQEGRFLFLNHYAEGFSEKDVIGSSLYQYIMPESVDLFRSHMEIAEKTWTTQHFEHTAQGDYGSTRTYDDYLVPLHGKDQEIKILAISRDITERKQAEEQIRLLNASLEQRVEERTRQLHQAQDQLVRHEKLAVLGQMAGGVGHELRNPLSVINNAVYYLTLVQPDADGKIKQYHAMIEQEVHTAEKIINDLLDFARLKPAQPEPVSIPDLVKRVLIRFPVPESVTVTFKLTPRLPKIRVDPQQIEQVLGNLVTNSCQAMPQGGRLTISVARIKKTVAIAVKDTGAGILPENMGQLFEPLFTTKAKGIGLGLAVSQKLAEANNGRIEVESEPGKGSTFTLFLPLTG
jgi:PAS domain S-box-containing protein